MRAWKIVAIGAAAALTGWWALHGGAEADGPVQLTIGASSAQGDLDITGQTFDEVTAAAQAGEVRVRLDVTGLSDVSGEVDVHTDSTTHTLWFTPTAAAVQGDSAGRLGLVVDWADAADTDPTITGVLRNDGGASLTALEPRWDGGTAFDSISVLLSANDATIAATDVSAGAVTLLGLGDALPSITVAQGASVAGMYSGGSEQGIDDVFADDNATAAGAPVVGFLTDNVANLADSTATPAGDPATLSVAVQAADLPVADWLDARAASVSHSFDDASPPGSVLTRVEDVVWEGTTFSGTDVLGDGADTFALTVPSLMPPFGMDALLGDTLLDVELTLTVAGGELSGSIGFTLPIGDDPAGVRVEMALTTDGDRVAGSLAVDSTVGLGTLVEWLSQQDAFTGVDLGETTALDEVQLNTAELSFASSTDGFTFTAFANASLTLTGDPVGFDVLLSVVKPTGESPTALVSLRTGQGIHLGDILPVPEGPIADLVLPRLTLITALGGEYSSPVADLGQRATSYLQDVYGTEELDDPFTVAAGVTLRAEIPVSSLGDDVAAALGWDPVGDIVLEGTIGLDFEQLISQAPADPADPPSSAVTSLSLTASIPNSGAPSWVPDGMTWPTGGDWNFSLAYDVASSTLELSAGLDDAELTLPGDVSPITVTLGAAFSTGPDGLHVEVSATIGDWVAPFGVDWVTVESASLSVSITKPPAPAPAEVAAAIEGSMLIAEKSVEVSVELASGADGVAATIRLALNDTITVGEVAEALGEDPADDTNPDRAIFDSLGFGPAELVVTVGSGAWSVDSSVAVQWDPYGEDDPIAADILFSINKPAASSGLPTRIVMGIKPREGVSLASFLPDSLNVPIDFPLYIGDDASTPDVDESSTIGFVYTNQAFRPFDLPEDNIARAWFDPLFAGVEPDNAHIVAGFSVYGALPIPDALKPVLGDLGLSDESQITGKLPIGSGAAMNTFSLSMGLKFDPAALPAVIHEAGLSLQISVAPSTSTVGIALTGSMTFAIEQGLRGSAADVLATVGVVPLEPVAEDATCPNGGVVKPVEGTFYCHDLLTLSLTGQISVSAGTASFSLIGNIQGDPDYGWHPFGIDWIVLRQLTATFGTKVDALGPLFDLGLAGNVDIAGKNISAAVQVGLRPTNVFPFLLVDFGGFRAAAPTGLSFGDIVSFANAVLPGDDVSLSDLQLPDIGLRNLSFSLSPRPGGVPELCIAPGLRVQADLYINPPASATASATPICDPVAGVPIKPGPTTSCAARRSEGCFAGILLDISSAGIIGQGSIAPFSIGPIQWLGGEIDLAMTASDQHLKVEGAGSISIGAAKLAEGQIKLNFTRTNMQYYGSLALINGAFNVMVDGEAGIGVFNGSTTGLRLHVLVATSSANIGNPSMGQALADGLASGLQELNKLVDGLDTVLESWDAAGGRATQLLTDLPAILGAVGIDVPSWVKDITDAIKYVNEVDVLNIVDNVVDAALNGVHIPLGSVCFGLLGCIDLGSIDVPGICSWALPSAINPTTGRCSLPSIARTYITPLFRLAIQGAIDGLDALDGTVLDTAMTALFDGIGKVVRLDCAEFYVDLGPGATNSFSLGIRGAVFGETVGLTVGIDPSDFTDLGSRIDEIITNLVENIGSGAALPTCEGYKPDLFGVGQADPEAPPLPIINVVTEAVDEARTATVNVRMTGDAPTPRNLTLAWGDGTSQLVSVDNTRPVPVTHVYADDDPTSTTADAKTVTVTDSSTGQSASDTLAVANVPPTITAAFASNVNESNAVSVDVTVTDPGDDTQTLLFTWGDGIPEQRTLPKGVKNGTTFRYTHTYVDDDPSGTASDVVVAKVSVLDDDLGIATAEATVTVNNVAPVVSAGADVNLDEYGTVTVSASFTDIGLGDTHGYIVDWGDGTATPLTTVTATAGAGSFTTSHQYGDDGVFTVTVSVADDDTGQGSDTLTATVANLAPTDVIDEPVDGITWIMADGVDADTTVNVPTMLATSGVPSSMTTRSADPGSDDLTVQWAWGDATATSRTWFVNAGITDPDPSTSVQPRAIIDTQSKTWTMPCLRQVTTTVLDDDGGSATDSTWVVVVGAPTKRIGIGAWTSAIQGKAPLKLTPAEVACYLRAVDHLSPVFGAASDAIRLATVTDAVNALGASGNLGKLDQALLSGYFEVMHGGIGWTERVDSNGDRKITGADMTFGELLRDTETLRTRGGASAKQLQERQKVLEKAIGV